MCMCGGVVGDRENDLLHLPCPGRVMVSLRKSHSLSVVFYKDL